MSKQDKFKLFWKKGDKMNEYKPHYKWAKKIMKLAYIYGVLNEGVDYNELIEV